MLKWTLMFMFQVVYGMSGTNNSSDSVYGFTTTSLLDIMTEFSSVSVVRIVFGYILMVSSVRWVLVHFVVISLWRVIDLFEVIKKDY